VKGRNELVEGCSHAVAISRDGSLSGICLHHFDNLEDYFVYPIQLAQVLPVIRVPLLPGDGQVALDLQQVFQRTYEAGPYAREIDYRNDPPLPRLSPEQAVWARHVLSLSGKRES
jgi:hypothetical protein